MCGDKRILVTYNSPITLEQDLKIKVQISNSIGFISEVMALFNRRGEPDGAEKQCCLQYQKEESTKDMSVFEGNVSFETLGYRTFFIRLKLNGKEVKIKYDAVQDKAVITNENLDFWKLFVYNSSFVTPTWVKGGIMYQIFVDTYNKADLPKKFEDKVVSWNCDPKWKPDEDGVYRNDQFYGGNLRGIINKLTYIKSLGTTVIYLTPIFKSPSSNKYDISDYMMIDEMFGTWDDLEELHKKANDLGMYIVIDCVFNHSSNENKLLTECPDMYDWNEKHTFPKCWWGYKHLVEFNKNSNLYLEKLTQWLEMYKKHVDGIRLDVADNLPDNILKFIKEHFDKYILGEVWKNAIIGDFREFLYGDELDGVMNYQFANAIYRYVRWGDFVNFRQITQDIYKLYPHEALSVSPIFLSSHDIPRIPNILVGEFMKASSNFENVWDMEKDQYWFKDGNFDTQKFRSWELEHDSIPKEKEDLAYKMQTIAVFLQYTLPGLPSIFAGDEAGTMGYKDPFNRKPFCWENIDKKRYSFYCKMGDFRNAYKTVFAEGDFEILELDMSKIIYRRDDMIFVINRTDKEIELSNELFKNKNIIFEIGEKIKDAKLQPYSAIAII